MMSEIQRIYFNDKPIVLFVGVVQPNIFPEYAHLKGAHQENFQEAIKILSRTESSGVVIVDANKEILEKELSWAFYPLHSAGGVVRNENGDVLMIFRRGKWDLPKGKQDDGESLEECAVREVCEETGLRNVVLGSKVTTTKHIYPMNGKLILKHTAWYLMTAHAGEKLQPQEEENIEQVMWVRSSEINKLLSNSFETITEVLRDAKVL